MGAPLRWCADGTAFENSLWWSSEQSAFSFSIALYLAFYSFTAMLKCDFFCLLPVFIKTNVEKYILEVSLHVVS